MKQSWADFRPEAAWRWPSLEEKMAGRPMPLGYIHVLGKTSDRMQCLQRVHFKNEKGKHQSWSGRRELTITVGRRGGGEGGWRDGVSTMVRRSGDPR
jgi:hypothetical protein